MFKLDKSEFTILLDDKPYDEFNQLQELAKQEGYKNAISDNKDSYFVTVMVNNIPYFSYTSILYGDNVLRVATKLYANPKIRNNISRTLFRKILFTWFDVFETKDFEHIKLKILSRHSSMSKWKNYFKRLGWQMDEDNVYQVANSKKKASSWKQLYYKGDITLLDRPKMSIKTYQLMF